MTPRFGKLAAPSVFLGKKMRAAEADSKTLGDTALLALCVFWRGAGETAAAVQPRAYQLLCIELFSLCSHHASMTS